MSIKELKKIDCIEDMAFGLNRTAQWRQRTAVIFPDDPRNLRAASALEALAGEAEHLTDAQWELLRPHFLTLTEGRWRDGVTQQAKKVGFVHRAPSLSSFVSSLVDAFNALQVAA
ncbi:MAG: hypothetical protein NTZ72_13945 [Afipia sp.]|nr:hypothetical protein [Afipia sp.]